MPVVHTPAQVGAMLEQLGRVNRAAQTLNFADLRRQLDDANARIIRLQRELAEARLLIAAYEDSAPVPRPAGSVGFVHNGERVMTAAEAAQLAGVSLSTVSRYCTDGTWRAHRDASDRWLIAADQPLARKRTAKRNRK